MKVLIIGASGPVGAYAAHLLVKQSLDVRCLVRSTSDQSRLPEHGIERVYGDTREPHTLIAAMSDIDLVINIVNLGQSHQTVLEALRTARISRSIFVSTTSIFTNLNSRAKVIKLAGEKEVISSGLAYTLIRPTMIYGSKRDNNMSRLIAYLRRAPVIPIFGNGKYLQQPVHYRDVAQAVVSAALVDHTIGKAYNVSGAAPLTYNQVIDTVIRLLNRRVLKLHVPVSPIVAALNTAERLHLRLPIRAEQVLRLNEDKSFDHLDAARDFNYRPCNFEEGINLQLQEMAQ